MWRKARLWCCSPALYGFLPQRSLTRLKTAHPSCTTLASSPNAAALWSGGAPPHTPARPSAPRPRDPSRPLARARETGPAAARRAAGLLQTAVHPACPPPARCRPATLGGALSGPSVASSATPTASAGTAAQTVHGLEQAWRPGRRERDGRPQPTFAESPQHLQTARIPCTLGRREAQETLATLDTAAPDTQAPRCTAPAASRVVDGLKAQRRHVIAPQISGPQGLICLAQGCCQGAHAAVGEDKWPAGGFEGGCEVPWRQAPSKPSPRSDSGEAHASWPGGARPGSERARPTRGPGALAPAERLRPS